MKNAAIVLAFPNKRLPFIKREVRKPGEESSNLARVKRDVTNRTETSGHQSLKSAPECRGILDVIKQCVD